MRYIIAIAAISFAAVNCGGTPRASAPQATVYEAADLDPKFSDQVLAKLASTPAYSAIAFGEDPALKLHVSEWFTVNTRHANWVQAGQGMKFRGVLLTARGTLGSGGLDERCFQFPANVVQTPDKNAGVQMNFGSSQATPGMRLMEVVCPETEATVAANINGHSSKIVTLSTAPAAEFKDEKKGVAFTFIANANEKFGIYTAPTRKNFAASVGKVSGKKLRNVDDAVAIVTSSKKKNVVVVDKQKLGEDRFMVVSTDDKQTNVVVFVKGKKGPVAVNFYAGLDKAEQAEVVNFAKTVRKL